MFVLKPRLRRITYVTAFEVIAIALSTILLAILSGGPATDSLPLAIAVSAIAMIWNYVFNIIFELWERKAHLTYRSLKVRLIHAGGFELGLFLFTVPLYMMWYSVGFVEAFWMEIAVLVFFLIYTFVFTYIFDMLFVLPQHQAKRERLA